VDKIVLLCCILASQFAGGLIGALFAFFSLTNVTETVNQIKGSIPDIEQVILRPKVSVSNAFNIEVICTFMFVFVILIVSDARLSPTKQGLLAVLGVVWNLMALTRTAGASGACLNPSVGFAQTILQYTQAVIPDEHFSTVMYMYVFGPLVGGCIAGLTHRGHLKVFARMSGRSIIKPSATEPLMDDYKEVDSKTKEQ
jgi:glycerol uptake facilitator-like aquaporin